MLGFTWAQAKGKGKANTAENDQSRDLGVIHEIIEASFADYESRADEDAVWQAIMLKCDYQAYDQQQQQDLHIMQPQFHSQNAKNYIAKQNVPSPLRQYQLRGSLHKLDGRIIKPSPHKQCDPTVVEQSGELIQNENNNLHKLNLQQKVSLAVIDGVQCLNKKDDDDFELSDDVELTSNLLKKSTLKALNSQQEIVSTKPHQFEVEVESQQVTENQEMVFDVKTQKWMGNDTDTTFDDLDFEVVAENEVSITTTTAQLVVAGDSHQNAGLNQRGTLDEWFNVDAEQIQRQEADHQQWLQVEFGESSIPTHNDLPVRRLIDRIQ